MVHYDSTLLCTQFPYAQLFFFSFFVFSLLICISLTTAVVGCCDCNWQHKFCIIFHKRDLYDITYNVYQYMKKNVDHVYIDVDIRTTRKLN